MRGVAIVLISSLALLGCHGKKAVVEPTQPLSTLKNIDLEKKPGFVEQHRIGMFTIGGWVNQKQGNQFQTVKPQVMMKPPSCMYTGPILNGIVRRNCRCQPVYQSRTYSKLTAQPLLLD